MDTARDNGKKPAMIKCSDYGHYSSTQLTSRMVDCIRNQMFGCKSIGVFVNAKSLTRTYNELTECLDRADDPEVFMYKTMSRDFGTIDFDEDGVYVLSFNTMKGLEFEGVLIPRCECIKSNEDRVSQSQKFSLCCGNSVGADRLCERRGHRLHHENWNRYC